MIDNTWRLVKKVKPKDIRFEELKSHKIKGDSFGNLTYQESYLFICRIDKNLSRKEQIITLLHEILHDHRAINKIDHSPMSNRRVERTITAMAKTTIKQKRPLVVYLSKLISQAKLING